VTRESGLARLAESFDIAIVGGGSTGLGAAVEAATRGYRTVLVEADDFAKATSSRSTKLVHGGVRYLQQGDIGLVREALRERTLLLANAPHLVHDLAFAIPAYRWYEIPYYTAGLTAYDILAGKSGIGRTHVAPRGETISILPNVARRGLLGSIVYHDGQFDDARLAITLARTAVDAGAAVVNYVRAERFIFENGRLAGIVVTDRESGGETIVRAKVAINATGIFADHLRSLDDAGARKLLRLARGSHVVVPERALGGKTALLVPRTSDARVLFVIPWHDHVVIGTTDVPAAQAELDPAPGRDEIDFIIEQANRYLERPIARADVTATFAGIRPLVDNAAASSTAKLSREHLIDISSRGLVTIVGGKWTTYRKMGEDVVDAAASVACLPPRPSVTANHPLHGATEEFEPDETRRVYGSDAAAVQSLADADQTLAAPLHPRLPYARAQVTYAARKEMARTVDDVLSRRTRAVFLDAAAALEAAGDVAALLATELERPLQWEKEQVQAFARIAEIARSAAV